MPCCFESWDGTLAREWLLAAGLAVIRVLPQEEDRAREIVARYSDKDRTLCDAISSAVLHVRGIRRALESTESPSDEAAAWRRDFENARKNLKAPTNKWQ
jgi:hypothetical protein